MPEVPESKLTAVNGHPRYLGDRGLIIPLRPVYGVASVNQSSTVHDARRNTPRECGGEHVIPAHAMLPRTNLSLSPRCQILNDWFCVKFRRTDQLPATAVRSSTSKDP